MSGLSDFELSGVPLSWLAPLYWRAIESKRPDAIVQDDKAVELVDRMPSDFERVREIPMTGIFFILRMMLTREMDRYVKDFLDRHPNGTVVHIGCGLDSRFLRVDNGRVSWYDLDLPEVIDLRKKLLGGEKDRYHLIGCSVLDNDWMASVRADASQPVLILAETVFIYFSKAEVKSLVLKLRDRFSGAELIFDAWKPYEVFLGNRLLSKTMFSGLFRWGLWKSRELERWGEGITWLEDWGYFDKPEPRLRAYRWMRWLFRWLKPFGIYRYKLQTKK